MLRRSKLALISALIIPLASIPWAGEAHKPTDNTVESVYPGLASGALTFAKIGELPDNVCVRADGVEITTDHIEEYILDTPYTVQQQLRRNTFYVAEQIATEEVLFREAREQMSEDKTDPSGTAQRQVIQSYLQKIVSPVKVTDAEAKTFYEENSELVGGAAFEKIEDQLKQYLLHQKQQDVVTEHIRTFGKRTAVTVSSTWTHEQAETAMDNPVDRARRSGNPSLVDFGASGCGPCDMMTPILDRLRDKYAGRLNVVFVQVREEQVLASRYRVQSIPVQVFFDENGDEQFRHVGFFPQDEIENKLAEMGIE